MTGRYSGLVKGFGVLLGVVAGTPVASAAPADMVRIGDRQGHVVEVQAREEFRGPQLYRGPRIYKAPRWRYGGIRRYRSPRFYRDAPVVPYTDDAWDRGYDRCVWIGRRARRTGNPYWRRRFHRCARYYFH